MRSGGRPLGAGGSLGTKREVVESSYFGLVPEGNSLNGCMDSGKGLRLPRRQLCASVAPPTSQMFVSTL